MKLTSEKVLNRSYFLFTFARFYAGYYCGVEKR